MPPEPIRPSSFAIDVPDALLARARAGDRAAFEQIYRWFERPVFTLALRISGDRDEAAETLQETMLKVIDRIADFRGQSSRGGSPFWGWLRQIAINEALMRLRRGRKLANEISDDLGGDFAEDQGTCPRPPPTPRCCNARWRRCRPPPAACCGCTTPRAIRTKRSPT